MILLLYILAFLIAASSPFWLWQIKRAHPLNVLILDKTVSDSSYREHKGLTWVLNNEKYVKPDGKPYDYSKDYRGFQPEDKKTYKTAGLPEKMDQYDVIYLADQYGVYDDDFFGRKQKNNKLLDGGLTSAETERLENTLDEHNKTLIAEFNTFASPTDPEARESMSNLLGIDWNGWIGRYFSDFSSREVPSWVKTNYQQETKKKWKGTGEGFVFVHSSGKILLLTQNELTQKGGLNFSLSKEGRKLAGSSLKSKYGYWFDVITPRAGTKELAGYSLPVKESAKKRLDAYHIPAEFPAIVQQQNARYNSFYFAGDYADEKEIPEIYQTRGISDWRMHFGNAGSFYWKSYVPFMKAVLKNGLKKTAGQEPVETASRKGVLYNSKTGASKLEIYKSGKWQNITIKGVNMGIAKPGYFPGETAITKAEYYRWFEQIGNMNANAIRVYTLHPPAFYEAFYEYNRRAKKPLYLFHGIWIEEEKLVKTQNIFADGQTRQFEENIRQIMDAVHGRASISPRAGHASGEYKYDISKYVIGYILGIEWDPDAVHSTNQKNHGMKDFKGTYFSSRNASPFEIWMSQMMNYTADYEEKQYKWQHSLSFTNWVTTDLLHHPAEPSKKEDMVSVDPNHIVKEPEFNAGMFASYHVYPYYPDFLNYEEKYVTYKDKDGNLNNYEGYLADLISKHNMPVLVAEFGVPASRGLTHENAEGMNQGNHSEKEQGEIDKRLFNSIIRTGSAGGLVFTWQDEWFKRTWNTMDVDDPDRRPYWNNAQTNEQHFGLLGFEPGTPDSSIYIDGSREDWQRLGPKASTYGSRKEPLQMYSDEGYLYIGKTLSRPINFKKEKLYFLFDTIPGQGKTKIRFGDSTGTTVNGVDFMAEIDSGGEARLLVDSYYDSFYYQYGHLLHMIPQASYAGQKDNEIFHKIRLALNKELVIPDRNLRVPFKSYEAGKLQFGNGNPASKDFDSLTDINISRDKKFLEMRIPWALLNVKDPSTKEVMGDMWKDGLAAKKTIKEIKVSEAAASQQPDMRESPVNPAFYSYSWNEWEQPAYYERLKDSYYIMKEAYSER